MTTIKPPPEAVLIRDRREQAGKSARQSALEAGMSPTRWREIERGIGGPAPAPTIAAMAVVTWTTAEDLIAAGRPDAAGELARRLDAEPDDPARDEVRALVEKVARSRHFTERQKRALAERIMREINDD